jgi:hypothetical protein
METRHAYLEHPRIHVFDTGIAIYKHVALCVQNCNCISFLNLFSHQFIAATFSVEVQGNAVAHDIRNRELQMMKCRRLSDLSQKAPVSRGWVSLFKSSIGRQARKPLIRKTDDVLAGLRLT